MGGIRGKAEPRRELAVYMHRTRLAPALGKTADAKRILTDHIRHLQSQGQRVTLSERILSSEGPMLLVTQIAPELAEIEQARRYRLTDADFQARAGQLLPLLSVAPRSTLWESVVDMPSNPPPTTIGELIFFYPAIGMQRQLERVLTEIVQDLQKMGPPRSLWRRIYSSDGPMLQGVNRYADLADLDQARKAAAPLIEQRAPAVIEVSAAPIQRRLVETIVPFQPA
jgi:hypothetical protein